MGILDKLSGQAFSRGVNNAGNAASNSIPNITTGLDIADNGLVKNLIEDGLDAIFKHERIVRTPILVDISEPGTMKFKSQSQANFQFIQLEIIKSTYTADGDPSKLEYVENKQILSNIVLPFPQDIQIQTDPAWGGRDGGILGDLLLNNSIDLGSLLSFGDKGTKARASVGGDLASQAGARIKHAAVDAVGKGIFGTDGASQFVDAAGGKVINPRSVMLFDGIEHRSFSVSFNFNPTSKKASEELTKFLIDIHEHAVPDIAGPYFTYPSFMRFKIINSKKETILDRGEVVIQSLNCNYTPDGVWASFENGQPIHVTLDVTFQERELPTRKTIKRLFGAKS